MVIPSHFIIEFIVKGLLTFVCPLKYEKITHLFLAK